MATDRQTIRTSSWETVQTMGLSCNASLPLLGEGIALRPQNQIVSRLLCMLPIGAVAYGFSREKALTWIDQEQLMPLLTGHECSFLNGGNAASEEMKLRIEAMWALAWVLSISDDISPLHSCPESFVHLLPDLRTLQPSKELRTAIQLRPLGKVVEALDLYYCLHWALREYLLTHRQCPKHIGISSIVERRRSLEWSLGDDSWEDVSLDT